MSCHRRDDLLGTRKGVGDQDARVSILQGEAGGGGGETPAALVTQGNPAGEPTGPGLILSNARDRKSSCDEGRGQGTVGGRSLHSTKGPGPGCGPRG